MIPRLLSDSEWSRLLAMADPTINPFAEYRAWVRQRVDWILCGTFVQAKMKSSAPDVTETFAAYAIAGEHFIRGMRALDSWGAITSLTVSHFSSEQPLRPVEPQFDEELASRIERYCKIFRHLEELDRRYEENEQFAPNSKPWLHNGVSLLFDVWRDELGQEGRPKKDFLAFAYAALAPLKLGVTENSVLESFDRHVKRRAHVRRRLRHLSKK
jgi:hypothetical protein